MVKTIHPDRLKRKFIRISTKKGGCTMKIFGDELNPSIPYKTFVLSVKDTAEWIVKEMLEKYGLKHENSHDYCLVQIIIPSNNEFIKEIILHDKDCPLNIYLNHPQKSQESIIFKIIKCSSEYMQLRQQLQIKDRILHNHFPMLIEVNNDGSNHSTPRVIKLHPNTTYVGRNIKTDIGSQYIYIDGDDINLNHCTLENQNNIITVIPYGNNIWYNGKLLSKPFILQHGALICFGQNSTFRYYDQNYKSIKQQNGNKMSMYTSLPILPINEIQPEGLQKKMSMSNITKFNVLPGLLEVPYETEVQFLQAVFDNHSLINNHFRLTPVYIFYMTLRHRLSPYDKSNLSIGEKQGHVISLLYRIENMINQKIEESQEHIGYLAYWLANISEFIYFLKYDRDLSKISSDIQIRLFKHIQRLFYYLINHLENELDKHLTAFTNLRDINSTVDNIKSTEIRWFKFNKTSTDYQPSTINDILAILSSIIDLFRKCRVNVELTIQIFSQLFHYINTWLFNRIVCCPELKLCSRFWGKKIFVHLKSLHNWAFKQGLETSLEYHLVKINQLCLLLQSEKRDTYDVQQLISTNIFQINPIQIKEILKNYILDKNEPPISKNFSQALLSSTNEYFYRQGLISQLSEESNLNIPFYLPDDGYSCENLRGIPQQLFDFIEPINRLGLCRLYTNAYSLGLWTEFLQIIKKENSNDKIETIVLRKKHNSLGLNIVSAKNESQQIRGIYVKSIIPDSAAADDGHLQPGDQILRVDQTSLLNSTHEQATKILKQCGPIVTLQILKNAANHHGLSNLLFSSPPPPLNLIQNTYYQSNPNLIQSKTQSLIIREDISSDKIKPINHTKSLISSPQINEYHNQEISSRSSDDFEEKLKRRLEQFEYERKIEREHIQQMSTKRQSNIEEYLRKNREREILTDKNFQISEQDQILLEAKKEQARLLKHICFPPSRKFYK